MIKNMVFLWILVTAFLLYDLLFNVSCFFPEQCHFSVHVVTAVLYSHVIMVAISEAFLNITRPPYSLYIPSRLLNSLRDNNIMYKNTEHYLNQTCFSHRNTDFFLGKKKAKLNVYALHCKTYKKTKISTLTSTGNSKLSCCFFPTLSLNKPWKDWYD